MTAVGATVGTITRTPGSPAAAANCFRRRPGRRPPRRRRHRRHRAGRRASRRAARCSTRTAHGSIPGLWDHHVHVVQWALAAQREPLGARAVGRPRGADHGRRRPSWPTAGASAPGSATRCGPTAPTLAVLDAATGDIPTYLINADVHSVWLNTAALRREGLEPDGVGILREGPAFEISRRLNDVDAAPSATRSSATMARDAAARGVVGLVDLDMAWNEEAWARRLAGGFDTLRVEFGIYPRVPRPRRSPRGCAPAIRCAARHPISPASGRSRSSPTGRSAPAPPRARTRTPAIRTTTAC